MSERVIDIKPALMRVDEAAHYLQVSKPTIYRLVKSGKLPHVRIGEKGLRFRPEDLNSYIEGQVSTEWPDRGDKE